MKNWFEYVENEEQEELRENDKTFFFKEKNNIETLSDVRERLETIGLDNIDLSGVREEWQYEIADSFETMYESYPELKGFVKNIRSANLPARVFACSGPRMGKDGFCPEILINEKMFSDPTLDKKVKNLEYENFKGEKYLAGHGIQGIIKHELAHSLHLKLISDGENVDVGEVKNVEYKEICKKYNRDAYVSEICNTSMEKCGIKPKNLAEELSTYGSTNMGEFFAEAISEYETSLYPRPLAMMVHEEYKRYLEGEKL